MNSPERQIMKEIRKTIPFTASSKIQVYTNKLIEGVKNLYSKNYKSLMKEINEDCRRRMDIPS
jgi:hypothetical protein